MERNEVIISLTKEEVKEIKVILQKKKIDLEYYSHRFNDSTIEMLDKAIKDLSEDKLVLNKGNFVDISNCLYWASFSVFEYDRATIVYNFIQKIAYVDFETEGEAHE